MRAALVLFLLAGVAAAAKVPSTRAVALHVVYFAPAPLVPLESALPYCTPQAGGTPVVSPAVQSDHAAASIAVAHYPADRAPKLSPETIATVAVGVGAEERAAIARSTDLVIVQMSAPVTDARRSLHDTDHFLTCLAEAMQGIVWDDGSRRLYGRAAFRTRRLDAWTDDRPPIAAEIAIHQYRSGDLVRSVTVGMKKLGLPDLVVQAHPQFEAAPVGALIVLVAESLAATPKAERQRSVAIQGVDIKLADGKREDGDADNRLVALDLGDTAHQSALLRKLFPAAAADERIDAAGDDPELAAIKTKAQERLRALASQFRPKPPELAHLTVQAPFKAADGQLEWMWVEIQRWEQSRMSGPLANDPWNIPTLHAGDIVTLEQGDVADYVLQRRGAKTEGGESMRVLEAREKAKK